MHSLITILAIFDFMLGFALVLALMARADERHAKQVKDRDEYLSHFRSHWRRDD